MKQGMSFKMSFLKLKKVITASETRSELHDTLGEARRSSSIVVDEKFLNKLYWAEAVHIIMHTRYL